MANVDAAYGFKPVGNLYGGDYTGRVNPYYIKADYGTALFVGDPIQVIADGSNAARVISVGYGTFAPGTLPEIELGVASASTFWSGVIVGFSALPNGLENIYSPASTEGVALVADDPGVLLQVQDDGADTQLAVTDVGANVIPLAGSGSTVTGLSGWQIDSSTAATTNTQQLRIVRMVNREDNAIGANAEWIVKMLYHQMDNILGI